MTSLLVANVVAMRSTTVGDYVYRVSQPAIAMGRLPGVEVVTVGVTSPHLAAVCRAADVLVLHLVTEEDLVPMVAERRRRGQPTVYEISDNFLATHAGIGISGWFADPQNRSNALHFIREADAVQVTGPGLLARFGALNPRTVVFPNHLERMGASPRPARPKVRLGWAGSAGHREDLRRITPALIEACRRHGNVEMAFMGDRRLFDDVWAAMPEGRKTWTPPGSLGDYLAFLETLDVGVAPMLPTPYNQCRSDVKFLEYASRGVAPVLSRSEPYLETAVEGATAFLFGDDTQLLAALDRLVTEPVTRLRIATAAHDYVGRERIEGQHAWARADFYRALGTPGGAVLDVPLTRLASDSAAHDVTTAPEEALVLEGIRAASDGDADGARSLFRRAAEDAPGYALPRLWEGRTHDLAGEAAEAAVVFESAVAVHPESLRVWLHLARAHAARGADAAAVAAIESALALGGEHAGTLMLAARLYEAVEPGAPHARHKLERAVALAPADASTHHALAERLLADGEPTPAAQHCARALELDRAHVAANALLLKLIAALEMATAAPLTRPA